MSRLIEDCRDRIAKAEGRQAGYRLAGQSDLATLERNVAHHLTLACAAMEQVEQMK